MDVPDEGAEVAASLADRLDRVTFRDLTAEQVTARIIDAVVEWGDGRGWRVYRRAASVMRLPPPLDRQHSVVDVACARPLGRPVVVEVDRTDRRRTIDKLLAEADAGRIPIWVRWGTGPFAAAPPPVCSVTCVVTSRNGPAGRVYSRVVERPPPRHSTDAAGDAVVMPIPFPDPGA